MPKNLFARKALYQNMPCIELGSNGYYALIAPEIGSNVLRLRDTQNKIDFFRFYENVSVDEIKASCEVYGFPTLYLPNRLNKGFLKTSDCEYTFPINEKPPLNNYIHGFLHRRCHKLKRLEINNESAICTTEYIFDRNDEMFRFFPVKFKAEITYILSKLGLEQYVTMTNLSEKMLPFGLGSHTSIKAPFADGGNPDDIRLYIPIGNKLELNNRCLPTERIGILTDYDMQYIYKTINPATAIIDNDMYFAKTGTLNNNNFHGAVIEDIRSGKKICYETGEEYGFWIIWNEWGNKGYFCPEPITWMINAPNLSIPHETSGYKEIAPKNSFTAYQHFFSMV